MISGKAQEMQFGSSAPGYPMVVALAILVVAIVLRNRRPRPLRIERLWIRPAILLALLVWVLSGAPPQFTPLGLGLMAIAALIGAAIGWQRGQFVKIDVHPDTHAVTSQASVAGVIFILAIVALRLFAGVALQANAGALAISPTTLLDAVMVLGVAMFAAQGVEMWLRAGRLLSEAQAAKGAMSGAPPLVR